jgi:hypothetical protein
MKRATESNVTAISPADALLVGDRCFGELGRKTVFLWRQYNDDYFNGALHTTPVLYVPTSPYGHWVGLHRSQKNIYLMFPGEKRSWGFVRGVLLHEMIHQGLQQEGKDTRHAGTPWCAEIVRISSLLGRRIWAGRYGVVRVAGKCVRANQPSPDGLPSLKQKEIATWPHSIGLEPPDTYNCK